LQTVRHRFNIYAKKAVLPRRYDVKIQTLTLFGVVRRAY